MVQEQKKKGDPSDWETITGLADDVDAWIKRAYFGFKDEYTAVSGQDTPMLLLDLVNQEGEDIATQGYSCGGGWHVGNEGKTISHDLRAKIVKSSIYGQFMDRVLKELGVPMWEFGNPLYAPSWEGLGFHWKQEEHDTLNIDLETGARKKATALMPVEYLGGFVESEAGGAPKAPGKKTADLTPAELELQEIATSAADVKSFQKTALKLAKVVTNDPLMASVLDDSDEGLYARLTKG